MIKQQWQRLTEREQRLLLIGGLCLSLLFFYMGIWMPLSHAIVEAQHAIIEKEATQRWLQQVEQQVKGGVTPLTNNALLPLISEQLNATTFQSYPYQLQQTTEGKLQLSFERVPYRVWISWLWSLSKQYHPTLQQLEVTRLPEEGMVKVSVLFS